MKYLILLLLCGCATTITEQEEILDDPFFFLDDLPRGEVILTADAIPDSRSVRDPVLLIDEAGYTIGPPYIMYLNSQEDPRYIIRRAVSTNLKNWIVDTDPSITPSSYGLPWEEQMMDTTWNAHTVSVGSVVKMNNQYFMFYSGGRYNYPSGWTSGIGVAYSEDGENWEEYDQNPVLVSSQFQTNWVALPYTIRLGSSWLMVLEAWMDNNHYEISMAISPDLYNWNPIDDGFPIFQPSEEDNWDCFSVANPRIMLVNNHWIMGYNATDEIGNAYQIGFAISDNLWNWRRPDRASLLTGPSGPDSHRVEGIHLFKSSVEEASPRYIYFGGRDDLNFVILGN